MRLPKATVRKFNLRAGHSVEIREAVPGKTLTIVPLRRPSLSLTEMTNRITNKNRHSAVDWGKAVGKEVW